MTEQSMLEAALEYAARGWPVFPCSPEDKAPLVEGGFKKASTDTNLIRGWWRRWPKALIAVPTGEAIGAFIVDLDLGSPPLITGNAYLSNFVNHVGGIDHTAIVSSASGGRHIYFKWDSDRPVGRVIRACPALAIDKYAKDELDDSGKRKKNAGVDVLGNSGYAIVPPSRLNDGRCWSWMQTLDDGLAVPNAKVMAIATKEERDAAKARPRQQREAPPPMVGNPERTQVDKFAQAALDKEITALRQTGAGGRNDALNKAAYNLGQLVGARALDEQMVWRALEEAAHACGLIKDDGYPAFAASARSGLEDGKAKPRPLAHVGARRRAAAAAQRERNHRPSRDEQNSADGASGADPVDQEAVQEGGGGDEIPPNIPDPEGDGPDDPPQELVAACALLEETDEGNAMRYKTYFASDLQYVREVGEHWWTGKRWEREGGKEAWLRCAHRIPHFIKLEVRHLKLSAQDLETVERAKPLRDMDFSPGITSEDSDEVREAKNAEARAKAKAAARDIKQADDILARLETMKSSRRKHAKASGNMPKTRGMMEAFQGYRVRSPLEMDMDPLQINVRNGTLKPVKVPDPENPDKKIWDMELVGHKRTDYITKMIDVDYIKGAECPKFMEFLELVQPKQTIRRFLQAFHGYALTGLTGEQSFVFNYGSGANGKTTFIETVADLMGNYASLLPAEAITGDHQRRGSDATPEFARLPGIRLVRIAELARGQGLREHTIKLLTGGDRMTVRHLHKEFFDLAPVFKAVASGNDRPGIGGVDEGIWRRVKLVPWEVFIPPEKRKPMPKMLHEFKKEWSGILYWLCMGLIDYLSNGLVIPPEIQEATESYRQDMDPVGAFLSACVKPQTDATVTARAMFKAYVAWCNANAVKHFGEKWFSNTMHTKGYKKREGRIREYLDVILDNVPDDPDAHLGEPPAGHPAAYR